MRKCPLSKTELQKKRRMFELTGENRVSRRKRIRAAISKPSASTVAELGDSKDAPKHETKADILAAKVDAEFDSKPRGKPRKK